MHEITLTVTSLPEVIVYLYQKREIGRKMTRAQVLNSVEVWSLLLVFLLVVRAQDCLKNFAEVENALLDNPENAYQIAKAFFRPRTEGETLCVTAYYYLGLNSTEEDKSNCPSITSNEDAGCSKWKWCINTFYMDLNLAQLQIFSFFAIYEKVSEIELRIPPFCVTNGTINEYLLRATTSVSWTDL